AEELGMPEICIPLAHAAIYVACCPKSNSAYLAVDAALQEVREGRFRPVPDHLRSGGKNRGYKYAHDFPNHYVKQPYMPHPIKFFEPGTLGKEAALIERLKKIKGE
ncbi:MAG: replication-associated recombination protein A, partial [Elusimicrobiaceae bacterium]|nr:replication-associated recombination protein A [Elusimicrobiaceae bacterium]